MSSNADNNIEENPLEVVFSENIKRDIAKLCDYYHENLHAKNILDLLIGDYFE
ncbi:hypothetical protein [Brevibacillus laterosporus]|uniref:hypothetical protein n=1 Tax=Brevibacillus laterosporus TaxID=1465 RepID=UPI0015969AFE|nr:hypothetical protein [Brevibacillus laterosporus]